MGRLTDNDMPTTWLFRGYRDELGDIVDELARDRSTQKTISCIGCSTGEEVYSLMALLDDAGINQAKVYGFDKDKRRIKQAKRNKFPGFSINKALQKEAQDAIPEQKRRLNMLLGKYFQTDDDNSIYMDSKHYFKYQPEFKKKDIFKSEVEKSDAILCRNVIRYYFGPVMGEAYDNIKRSLAPKGYLALDKDSMHKLEQQVDVRKDFEQVIESKTGYVLCKYKGL